MGHKLTEKERGIVLQALNSLAAKTDIDIFYRQEVISLYFKIKNWEMK